MNTIQEIMSLDMNAVGDEVAMTYWAKEQDKSFSDIVNRVVNYVCSDWALPRRERMREILLQKKFVPNSPCWMNAGTHMKSLAACFVLPLEDSMESIFNTARDMAMVFKEGGGVGVSLSKLRPEGASVHTTKGVSSGPISFLKVFDSIIAAVRQGGARRGAAMANLRVDHPDILTFIRCKTKEGEIANFNISIALTDEFMEACVTGATEFTLRHEKMDKEVTVNPQEILDAIVDGAWTNGEPGVQFIDTVNRSGTVGYNKLFERFNVGIEVSNPCGETFLKPNESCNLGAMNLYKYVVPIWDPKGPCIDYKALEADVEYAVDFLNSLIDKSEAPIEAINKVTKESRKIGLGVMGLADMLSAMGIRYGSTHSLELTKEVFSMINRFARGVSQAKGYNNATLTLVAPTGTTGVVAGASGGIEPHFRAMYDRKSVKMGNLKILPVSLLDFLKSLREEDAKKLVDELLANKGKFVSGSHMDVWITADQVPPKDHMNMLVAVQSCVDNSVSKTINLPNSATKSEIKEAIVYAWRNGVKGFTVYRDGSREEQVLNEIGSDKKEEVTECSSGCTECSCTPKPVAKRSRPTKTTGETDKVKIGCGNLYVTVNSDSDGPCEVFTNLGRSGGCPSQSEATARLISLALRSGVNPEEVVEQLKGIRCLSTIAGKSQGKQPDGTRVLSCPDAIGKHLESVLKGSIKKAEPVNPPPHSVAVYNELAQKVVFKPIESTTVYTNTCPRCSEVLALSEGCRICMSCGYSKCG